MPDFEKSVKPILEAHCVKCHGPDKQKSDIRFDTLATDFVKNRPAAETWHDARDAIHLGEMPPEDEPQLSSEDRKTLTDWIDGNLKIAAKHGKPKGGVLRRLNRVEYQNTMSDLLGVEMDFAENLPPDTPSEAGFLNDGEALSMSPMQLEFYLEAARKGLARAIVTGDAPEKFSATVTETAKLSGNRFGGNYGNRLGLSGVFVAKLTEFPDAGDFVVRVKARAELVEGAAFPRLRGEFGYRADTQLPSRELGVVDVTSEEPVVFEFRGRMEDYPVQSRTQSKFPGQLIRLTNVFDDGKERKRQRQIEVEEEKKNRKGEITKRKVKKTEWIEHADFPKIVIESVEFEGPIFDAWPPRAHREILFPSEKRDVGELVYAEAVVAKFMRRAYRRPVANAEVKAMLQLFAKIRPTVDSFEEAMRETLALVLVSPDFLYLVNDADTLDDFELASRLSYFLWSTMPDERLLKLAENGDLHKPEILTNEVDRMLADERSQAFVEQFSNQWLDLGAVERVAVNPQFYAGWDTALEPWMQEETRQFFGEILRKDLSALNFLDSDFAMLNEPLARHYGIENGPRGTAFERVKLPIDAKRGGLLGQASVLLGNSTGEDSHPILRAVWIRERLLDDPPAPPPPNVPALDAENPNFAKLSVRNQLEIHRNDPACADCHRGLDPWGIALEQFDAVGNWREKILRIDGRKRHELPVESATTLPGGHEVDGAEALKNFLKTERHEQFSKALTTRMTGYALGREIDFEDEAEIEKLSANFAASGHRLRSLIHGVVGSPLFRAR